jgi:hypothetical protein
LQPDLFCAGDTHAHFDAFHGLGSTSIILERELQDGLGAGKVSRKLALVDLESIDILDCVKADGGRRRSGLGVGGVCVRLWGMRPRRHFPGLPLDPLPTHVVRCHLSSQVFRLEKVEQPEDRGLVPWGWLLVAPGKNQGSGKAKKRKGVFGFHDHPRLL